MVTIWSTSIVALPLKAFFKLLAYTSSIQATKTASLQRSNSLGVSHWHSTVDTCEAEPLFHTGKFIPLWAALPGWSSSPS